VSCSRVVGRPIRPALLRGPRHRQHLLWRCVAFADRCCAPSEGWNVENRRLAERQSAHWKGRCHIEDEPSDLWRECTIIDVSTLGLGIDLCHPDPVELLGLWRDGVLRLHVDRGITVHLESGPTVDMTVAGQVRNAGSGPDGIVRAGIEFVGLTETERSLVDPSNVGLYDTCGSA